MVKRENKNAKEYWKEIEEKHLVSNKFNSIKETINRMLQDPTLSEQDRFKLIDTTVVGIGIVLVKNTDNQ